MSLNIANCPRCGKVFSPGIHDICPACVKQTEEEYDRCHQFLKENKGANIYTLSKETDVSIKQITKFIREGRISLVNFPEMGYPCESCGTIIRSGVLCVDCHSKFKQGVEAIKQERQAPERFEPTKKVSFDIKNRKGSR